MKFLSKPTAYGEVRRQIAILLADLPANEPSAPQARYWRVCEKMNTEHFEEM